MSKCAILFQLALRIFRNIRPEKGYFVSPWIWIEHENLNPNANKQLLHEIRDLFFSHAFQLLYEIKRLWQWEKVEKQAFFGVPVFCANLWIYNYICDNLSRNCYKKYNLIYYILQFYSTIYFKHIQFILYHLFQNTYPHFTTI